MSTSSNPDAANMDATTPAQSELDDSVKAATTRVMRALYPEVTTTGSAGQIVTGTASFVPQPEHVGAPGWVQGGLSATVLDYFCARVAGRALNMSIATGTLDLRYRQPVLLDGGPYLVEGETEPPRARTVRVSAAIKDAHGRNLIEASGLFIGVAPLAEVRPNEPGS